MSNQARMQRRSGSDDDEHEFSGIHINQNQTVRSFYSHFGRKNDRSVWNRSVALLKNHTRINYHQHTNLQQAYSYHFCIRDEKRAKPTVALKREIMEFERFRDVGHSRFSNFGNKQTKKRCMG
mmetsp:Transcript_53387/g.64308  ORF Transcript_53387/g.64308 Transcript_53387/m.64308 type:complete len:123 (-) Transcript_53387:584-952(-)